VVCETLNNSSFNEISIDSPTVALSPVHKQKPPRKVFLYNKANTEKISENLKTIDLNSLMPDKNPNTDHLWEYFKQKIHDIMNEFIPTKMINNSKRKLPWINKEIKSLIRKRNKLY
jgi:S-formylglutathione hydrolase FrmB